MVTVRPAKTEDFAELRRRMVESGGIVIDLNNTPSWIAEEDGRPIGLLVARLHWQLEPLLVFPEVAVKATRRRAMFLLWTAAEMWIADRALNGTGIYQAFATIWSPAVRKFAKRVGWLHQYKRAPLFIKHF